MNVVVLQFQHTIDFPHTPVDNNARARTYHRYLCIVSESLHTQVAITSVLSQTELIADNKQSGVTGIARG